MTRLNGIIKLFSAYLALLFATTLFSSQDDHGHTAADWRGNYVGIDRGTEAQSNRVLTKDTNAMFAMTVNVSTARIAYPIEGVNDFPSYEDLLSNDQKELLVENRLTATSKPEATLRLPRDEANMSKTWDTATENMSSSEAQRNALSYEDLLILCSPPPPVFSNTFFGDTWLFEPVSNCSFDKGIVDSFTDIMHFCEHLYFVIYRTDLPVIKVLGNKTAYIYHDSRFESICIPLLKRKYSCRSNTLFTICENSAVFLHSDMCPRPPTSYKDFEIHVANYVSLDDFVCLKRICDGTYFTMDLEVHGVRVKLSNFNIEIDNRTCDMFPFATFENLSVMYVDMNFHWPCCFPYFAVYWSENPQEYGLNAVWHLLPLSCRVGEICLLILVACVATGGVVGNLMVVAVKWHVRRRNQESDLLRASLAFSDFLISAFVVVPSLYQHVKPLFVPDDLFRIFPESILLEGEVPLMKDPDKTVEVNILAFIQAVVFSSSSIASLLTLFLLSVDRFVLTGRGMFYKQYVTPLRVRYAIVMVWITSCLNASLMSSLGKVSPSTLWMTFTKIPIGMSSYAHDNLVGYFGYIVYLFLLSMSIPCTAMFSILAIRNFLLEQSQVLARWGEMQMRVTGPFEAENHYILVTQLLMTVSFLVSVIPITVFFLNVNLLQLSHFVSSCSVCSTPLFTYFSWWLFLASTAWNPWIYNMRSREFRSDLRETIRSFVPSTLTEKLREKSVAGKQCDRARDFTRRRELLSRVGIAI